MCAPDDCRFLMIVSDGASRMSSVSGLKESPQIPISFPSNDPRCFCSFLKRRSFWLSLISSTDFRREKSQSSSCPFWINALTSFGKQLPPYPIPAFKNLSPMRLSRPIPFAMSLMFPPERSQKPAISLMKLILVARKEFAAYLMISAVFMSVKKIGVSNGR